MVSIYLSIQTQHVAPPTITHHDKQIHGGSSKKEALNGTIVFRHLPALACWVVQRMRQQIMIKEAASMTGNNSAVGGGIVPAQCRHRFAALHGYLGFVHMPLPHPPTTRLAFALTFFKRGPSSLCRFMRSPAGVSQVTQPCHASAIVSLFSTAI